MTVRNLNKMLFIGLFLFFFVNSDTGVCVHKGFLQCFDTVVWVAGRASSL